MKGAVRFGKIVVLDILGILLIIAAALFGWVPGPGGIPLFLAGLSLLAVNHSWARRLLDTVKREGFRLMDKIFNDHPVVKALYDLVSALLIVGAIIIIDRYTSNRIETFALMAALFGLGLFLGNRKRLQRFVAWIKRIYFNRA